MTPTRRGFVAALAAIPALFIAKPKAAEPDAQPAALTTSTTSTTPVAPDSFRRRALHAFALELSATMNRAQFVDAAPRQRAGTHGWRQYNRSCLSDDLTVDVARTFAREIALEVMEDGGTQFTDLELPHGVFQAERVQNDRVSARLVVVYDIMIDALPVRFDVLARKA